MEASLSHHWINARVKNCKILRTSATPERSRRRTGTALRSRRLSECEAPSEGVARRVTLAGITRHPTEAWITQMARNAVDDTSGGLRQCRYVLHDRDAKFCAAFEDVLASERI